MDIDRHDRFFQMVETPFERNREQIWELLETRLSTPAVPAVIQFPTYRVLMAAAAILVLLLGTFAVMRYYKASTVAEYGKILSCNLPDGSSVELNAGSRMSYHPLWWRFSRSLKFEGEGYFDVQKGKLFRIISPNGTTEVLGTSFTIYARADEYRVACITGMVRVVSPAGKEANLTPDYTASIKNDGNIMVTKEEIPQYTSSWVNGMFSFTSRPLRLVLDEIQRQYNVTINLRDDREYFFTGYFSKDKPLEELLELVCKPFGLTFAKRSAGVYEILQN